MWSCAGGRAPGGMLLRAGRERFSEEPQHGEKHSGESQADAGSSALHREGEC